MSFLDAAPIWLIGVTLAATMIVAEEIGYRCRRHMPRVVGGLAGAPGKAEKDDGEQGVSNLVGAALALLSLLYAFTFAMAQDRYDQRRGLVMAEAAAAKTSYLRYQAFDDPERSQLGRLMVDYARLRSQTFDAQKDRARLEAHVARTSAMQAQIWAAVLRGTAKKPELVEPVMESTNDMFEVASRRRAIVDARLPAAIQGGLLVFALLSAFYTGYGLALNRRHRLPLATLFVLFAFVFMLVLDLDRSYSGTIRVSQGSMIRAAGEIAAMEAARTGAAPQLPRP